jgi:hypothetical protein
MQAQDLQNILVFVIWSHHLKLIQMFVYNLAIIFSQLLIESWDGPYSFK